jgi:uncharacterized protein (TIGR02647 family)
MKDKQSPVKTITDPKGSNMHFDEELVNELNLLVKFNLDSIQEGIKIHHSADATTRAAAIRLFDKGFITQEDGGYLTELGRELAELAQSSVTLLTSARCM